MVACKGPAGPMGPKGIQGLTGPTGITGPTGEAGEDFSYFNDSATVDYDGTAAIALPIGAGTATKAPLINCYIGDGSGVWLLLGTDVSPGGATAAIVWAENQYVAVVVGAPPGWIFWVSVAW